MTLVTYALRLVENKFYIGSSTNFNQRARQHFTGQGSAWTKKYPPTDVLECVQGNVENEMTFQYIDRFGFRNVRGGVFVKIDLPEHQVKTLKELERGKLSTCFRCGGTDHFAKTCKK